MGPGGSSLVLTTLLFTCHSGLNPLEELASSRVQGVSRLVAHRLVTVRTSSATLVTTPEHPFAKVGAGWARAADLTRGDRVETAGGGNTTVLGVEIREVQPTAVYNLTVSRTHAYFVGPQALLVHNTDCGGPSAGNASRKRKREEDSNEAREQLRARRARQKALLEARWRERQRTQREMKRRPFNDMPGRPNCGQCVLAALNDLDRVSTLFQITNFDPHNRDQRLSVGEMNRSMKWLGLTSDRTPEWKPFPGTDAEIDAARQKSANDPRSGQPRPTFPFNDRAKNLMETSSANTFVVTVQYFRGDRHEAHSLLAVKRDDNSIVYVDLQKRPPKTYHGLDPHINLAMVFPTDVDWRSNRQIHKAAAERVNGFETAGTRIL
jgi:hypothetical protein